MQSESQAAYAIPKIFPGPTIYRSVFVLPVRTPRENGDPSKPVRLRVRQRTEQHAIDNGENRHVRADAQSQNERGCHSK